MEATQPPNGDNSKHNAPYWRNYTYKWITDADYNRTQDVSLGHFSDWMSYCTHHSDKNTLRYVHVHIHSDYLCVRVFYNKHHSDMDNPQYVQIDVP
jgi:hypothetical protein